MTRKPPCSGWNACNTTRPSGRCCISTGGRPSSAGATPRRSARRRLRRPNSRLESSRLPSAGRPEGAARMAGPRAAAARLGRRLPQIPRRGVRPRRTRPTCICSISTRSRPVTSSEPRPPGGRRCWPAPWARRPASTGRSSPPTRRSCVCTSSPPTPPGPSPPTSRTGRRRSNNSPTTSMKTIWRIRTRGRRPCSTWAFAPPARRPRQPGRPAGLPRPGRGLPPDASEHQGTGLEPAATALGQAAAPLPVALPRPRRPGRRGLRPRPRAQPQPRAGPHGPDFSLSGPELSGRGPRPTQGSPPLQRGRRPAARRDRRTVPRAPPRPARPGR